MLGKLNNQRFFKVAVGILFFTIIAAAFLFAVYNPVYAQTANSMLWGNREGAVQQATGLGSNDPRIVAAQIIRIFLGFLGIIFIILVIYAGWLWMTSGGDESNITRAKKILTNAIIGLIIILMSFAIVSFILNKLYQATTGGGPGTPTGPGSAGVGLGAMGSCTISMVYPEPNQTDVPRNTSIIVTFKEPVNPDTVCDTGFSGNPTVCDGTDPIRQCSTHIFKTTSGDSCPTSCPGTCPGNITDVIVASNDNLTFVLTPVTYLGSPSENIWYSVHLSREIQKPDATSIFETCRSDWFEWQFEVNNRLDLTPPQVSSVIPEPDDLADTRSTTPAVRAQGQITVIAQPTVSQSSTYPGPNPLNSTTGIPATITVEPNNTVSGNLRVTIASDGVTASLSQQPAGTLLGAAVFSGQTVTFPGIISLTVSGTYSAGNEWNINNVTAATIADTVTVGNRVYSFVSAAPGPGQILRGANEDATAQNIANTLNSDPDVTATNPSAPSPDVDVTARQFGISGNNIALITSNTSHFTIAPMSGGQDSGTTYTPNDKSDKPRNAVIQINFNEAINPMTVSGLASEVFNYIKVVNAETTAGGSGAACTDDTNCVSFDCDTTLPTPSCVGDYLAGKFIISNVYRTVEFISDNECGVNGCGEKIYCLPENGHIRVELAASNLDGCTAGCTATAPYTNCTGGHCADSSGIFYPKSVSPPDGVVDTALNSLDGDRSGDAEGPSPTLATYYNENTSSGDGDSFLWSFFVTDRIDLDPPIIDSITPRHRDTDVSLSDPMRINFSKLMMISSLGTGSVGINDGQKVVEHKRINLWNFANQPTGYYIKAENVDRPPQDGEYDYTAAFINHSMLYDAASYRAQVGSGVKTIYQNCFNPSVGSSGAATCNATANNPSCCCMTPVAGGSCNAAPCP